MATTRASKRSTLKAHRRSDDTSSSRTRSRTHRACERETEVLLHKLLLMLDPAAIVRAVKVLAPDRLGRRCLQRQALWNRLLAKHFGGRRAARGASRDRSSTASDSSDENNWSDIDDASDTFELNGDIHSVGLINACGGLDEFLAVTKDRRRFKENVLIIKGDIGSITELDGRKVDGIAFPTASSFHNSGVGAAAAVFRRAGAGLTYYIQGFTPTGSAGTTIVTSGFGAGVDKLIHAVGPSASTPQCHQVLEATYTSIMEGAQRESLKCLALASISTGNQGVPCKEGARAALRAIQRFLSKEKWSGIVGIVCYEQKVFDAFTQEKQAMLEVLSS